MSKSVRGCRAQRIAHWFTDLAQTPTGFQTVNSLQAGSYPCTVVCFSEAPDQLCECLPLLGVVQDAQNVEKWTSWKERGKVTRLAFMAEQCRNPCCGLSMMRAQNVLQHRLQHASETLISTQLSCRIAKKQAALCKTAIINTMQQAHTLKRLQCIGRA